MEAKKNSDTFYAKIIYGAVSLAVLSLLVAVLRLATHGFLNALLY